MRNLTRLSELLLLTLLPTLLSCVSAPGVGTQRPRLTPELLWKLGRVSDPQLSPDGRSLLYTVRTYDLEANAGSSQIFMRQLSEQRTVQITKEASNWNPRWSVQGTQVAFLSTASGAPQIWVMDLVGAEVGRRRQVSKHPGGVANMAWSPDGRHFSFTAAVKLERDIHDLYPDLPKADAKIFDDLLIRHWDHWRDGNYSHLFV